MKAILRLKGKIRPEKQRSAVSYEQSVLPYQLPTRSWLIPKTYYLIPILFLVFVSCSAALAQEPVGHTAPAAKAEITHTLLNNKKNDTIKRNGEIENARSLLTQKNDYKVDHDINFPFLISGNGGNGNSLIYHSVLTGYQEGLSSRTIHATPALFGIKTGSIIKGYRIGSYNTTLKNLYKLAYFDGTISYRDNEIIVEALDLQQHPASLYSYEAITPYALGRKAVYKQLKDDLAKFFPQYEAVEEKRMVNCLLLVRTSNVDKIASKGGEVVCTLGSTGFIMKNYHPPSYFIERLHYYLQGSPPLIDATEYTGKIDIEINANLNNVNALNKELEKYDLRIIEQECEIDALVIRDTGKSFLPLDLGLLEVGVENKEEDWKSLEERRIQ